MARQEIGRGSNGLPGWLRRSIGLGTAWLAVPTASARPDVLISGRSVYLRLAALSDYAEWAALRLASADFLRPWEPLWPADAHSSARFRQRLARQDADIQDGSGLLLLTFRYTDNAMVGGINLTNIRRGAAQTGTLGYWSGAGFARHGYTLDAVRALVQYALGPLQLARVEAACLPRNAASHGLLLKAGFEQEGLARRYLEIDGVREDHLLFGYNK